jgi:hypothetical protein
VNGFINPMLIPGVKESGFTLKDFEQLINSNKIESFEQICS